MTDISQESNTLLVAGAVHIDEVACAQSTLIMRASNPISWSRSVGGVACNAARAAQACKAADATVKLVGTIGQDADGRLLEQVLVNEGLVASLHRFAGEPTGRYSAVIDTDGELALGLSDSTIAERLTAEQLMQGHDESNLKALMLDANLSQSCIEQIAQKFCTQSLPIAVMAVSPVKAQRLLSTARHVQLLFCNRREAAALCQEDPATSVEELANGLQASGFTQFVLTDGKQPIVLQMQQDRQKLTVPRINESLHHVNGAGDALAGATFAAWAQGVSLQKAITDFGLPMAADIVTGRRPAPALL